MIQRIQTVYLFLGSAVCFLPVLLGFAPLSSGTPEWVATLRTVLFVLAAVLGVVSVFLYSNRQRQLAVAFWAQTAAIVCFIVVVGTLIMYSASGPGIQATVSSSRAVVTTFAPIAAGIAFFAARRGINSDIKLVKSMDRLRD